MTSTYSEMSNTEALQFGCGCSACQHNSETSSTNTTNYWALQVENGVGSILASDLDSGASGDGGNASALLSGSHWGAGSGAAVTITYSFLSSIPTYSGQYVPDNGIIYETQGFKEFSNAQKTAARDILDMVETFTNITFIETTGQNADITWAQANLPSGVGAWAYYPSSNPVGGDIYTNRTAVSETNLSEGSYSYYTLMHELGHALGLMHTFSDGNGNGAGFNGAENTEQFSVMAYDWSAWGARYAESFMLYDIAALQQEYGSNTNYNSGNTTYVLENAAAKTLWDGGGVDTLDGSTLSGNLNIDLRAASFSSIGNTNNFAIAYGVEIENVNTGSGNDTVTTNNLNNVVNTNAGTDTILGSSGSDTINGGTGNDTINYSFEISDFIVSLVNSTTVTLQNIAQSWTDTLSNIETFIFNSTNYTFEQVAQLDMELETLTVRFDWNLSGTPSQQNYNANTNGSTFLTQSDLGISGSNTNAIQIIQDFGKVTITNSDTVNFAVERVSYFDTDVDDITFNNFQNVYAFLGNMSEDLTLDLNQIQRVSLWTGSGNDNITITVREWEIGQSDYLTLNLGDGTNTLLVNGTHTSIGGVINGGDNDDTINLWVTGNQRVNAGGGNDTISTLAGIDKLYGGTGNDIISAGDGADFLYGEAGQDTLSGGNGNDTIFGGNDDDTLNGNAGADFLHAGAGNDILNGGADGDTLTGREGDDTLNGGDGNDRLQGDGGAGQSITGNDTLNGEAGDDALYGGAGDDILNGGIGNDQLFGDDIAPSDGFTGNDTMNGGDGDDRIFGNAGNDILNGDAGADYMVGGTGNDTMTGGAGNDVLYGEAGEDILRGGEGIDTLRGGDGNDTLYGDGDRDHLFGEGGADTFVLEGATAFDNLVFIRDLNIGEGDAIDISDVLEGFNAGSSDIADFVFFSEAASHTFVWIDSNGATAGGNTGTVARLNNVTGLDVTTLYNNGDIIV